MYPAYTQLVAKWSSPSICDARATGWGTPPAPPPKLYPETVLKNDLEKTSPKRAKTVFLNKKS